jgi:AbrB family looped-hinge helix DNA binding protein
MKTKVTSRGQITIPIKVRTSLGLKKGDEVEFETSGKGYLLKKKAGVSPFDKYLGYLDSKKGNNPDSIIEELRDK